MKYNRLNAFVFQLTEFISLFWPKFLRKAWVKKLRSWCFLDWCRFRAEVTMRGVDEQIEKYHEEQDELDKEAQKPIYTEKPGDTPLGGEMRLTAPWHKEKDSDTM